MCFRVVEPIVNVILGTEVTTCFLDVCIHYYRFYCLLFLKTGQSRLGGVCINSWDNRDLECGVIALIITAEMESWVHFFKCHKGLLIYSIVYHHSFIKFLSKLFLTYKLIRQSLFLLWNLLLLGKVWYLICIEYIN